jgi:ubiquinone/menaquinone biosynthesis C-methylase UbiE
MGLYERSVFPWICDKLTSGREASRLRKQVLVPARGRVLEVGFGTGLNAAHYPRQVERVVGVDSNPGVEKLARARIAAAAVPIEFRLASAGRLPFDDHSFDTVVTTLTLCSVPDAGRALAELRRVLAPEGQYLLLEHGLAEEPGIQKWQRRLSKPHMLISAGCQLDLPVAALVTGAGFRFSSVEHFEWSGTPKVAAFTTLACAVPG